MGRMNVLVEGGSGTGKSSVCQELRGRGFDVVDGDRDLAYQGDPRSGEAVDGVTGTAVHHHHIWRVDEVRALAADRRHAVTFFCGGSRNFAQFLDVFDRVFVLEADLDTVHRRLDQRGDDEWGGRGRHAERELIERLHRTGGDTPRNGIPIDATAPLDRVVDEILRQVDAADAAGAP